MKINLSLVISVIAIILVIVLGGGLISNLFSNIYLSKPKIEVVEYQYFADDTGGEIVTSEKPLDDAVVTAKISISEVKGATKYEIYINEEYMCSTIKTEFDLKKVLGGGGGTVDVQVRAIRETSDAETIVSDYSNVITLDVISG